MVIIKHNRATLTVQPHNAEPYREALAKLDKGKGPKLPRLKGNPKHDSMKRFYPVFTADMSTADYLARYAALNGHLHLVKINYGHADRPAAMLDPSIPEVEELPCEQ